MRREPARVLMPGRDRDCMRVTVDRDVVLEPNVKSLEVFAHQHEVDVVVTAARISACRSQVGVELELLAQPHIDRAESAADRRQRTLERQLVRRMLSSSAGGSGSPCFCAAATPLLRLPRKRLAERIENLDDSGGDLGSDSIPGNQGRNDRLLRARCRHLPRHRFDVPRRFGETVANAELRSKRDPGSA